MNTKISSILGMAIVIGCVGLFPTQTDTFITVGNVQQPTQQMDKGMWILEQRLNSIMRQELLNNKQYVGQSRSGRQRQINACNQISDPKVRRKCLKRR